MSMDPMAPAESEAPEAPASGGTLDAMIEALMVLRDNAALGRNVVAAMDDEGSASLEVQEGGDVLVSSGSESVTIPADEILADDPDDDGDEAALVEAGAVGV